MPAPSASLLTGKLKLIIAAIVVVVAFTYFGFTALKGASAYYLTVDELVARGPSGDIQQVQVKGKLVPETFQREGASLLARFQLTENGATINVVHEGVLPDLFFNQYSEIVLVGQYPASGVFQTERILVKCPSKYQSAEYNYPTPVQSQ